MLDSKFGHLHLAGGETVIRSSEAIEHLNNMAAQLRTYDLGEAAALATEAVADRVAKAQQEFERAAQEIQQLMHPLRWAWRQVDYRQNAYLPDDVVHKALIDYNAS